MTSRPNPIVPLPYDLKLRSCVEFSHSDWNLPRPKTEALNDVSAAFRGNLSRVRLLMQMPAHVGDLAMRMQRRLDLAEFEITGRIDDLNPPEAFREKIDARWREHLIQEQEDDIRSYNELQGTKEWDNHAWMSLQAGIVPAERMANALPGAFGLIESLSAYLTISWTTIESLCGDLWEAALNHHPQGLAQLEGPPNRLKKVKDTYSGADGRNSERQPKQVRLDLIASSNFDIKNRMGSILRLRFEFSRLEIIREAYATAFWKDSAQIDRALSDNSLDALSVARNVIVHRAGKADAIYCKRAQSLKLPIAPIGSPIRWTGDSVVGLIKPAIHSGCQLFRAVDEWLIKHGRS